jgi:enoyl-CoA hydratase/carnithine racemase
MSALLLQEVEGQVVRLTLNSDATRNALSLELMRELHRAIAGIDAGAIVIASTGKVFSSGHNLKELTAHRADVDQGAAFFGETFDTCARLMMAIAHSPCAVIAEVDGMASAAGCQLVATCDLAYASPHSGFCTPGVNIGLFCSTPMVALTRNVVPKHALEMLLTGAVYDAAHAERIGLINKVLAQTELRSHVMGVAGKIASKSQTAIGIGKRSFHDQLTMPLPEAYAHMAAVMTKNMMDGAACEGIEAFLAKRAPNWQQ